MSQIKKLPQEIVNQIAAGEVIERPASVVKELVDNSIDALATEIKIRLKNGGISLIEVFDNGAGINKDDLQSAFEPHATSKISSFEDLNNLLTMGFRGEALSTIQSVAEVTAISKSADSDSAYKITYNKTSKGDITPAAHNQGTSIIVENIFYNVPARQKFLKTQETEYRKVLEALTAYFLIHPEVHFTLERDGKVVYNLPAITNASPNSIHPARIKEVLKGDFTDDMISFFYDGDGMKVGGLVAHPKHHALKTNHMYMFVNNRPIYDNGIVKSVMQGLARFMPHGEKVPFIINVQVNPSQVDVNVHPRKEEVRFINPYRVYSAIEMAITSAVQKEIKDENVENITDYSSSNSSSEIGYSRLRGSSMGEKPAKYNNSYTGTKELNFRKPNEFNIHESIEFSKQLLKDAPQEEIPWDNSLFDNTQNTAVRKAFNYYQIFNKYIIVEYQDQIWVVDQHAADERINYERLMKCSLSETKNSQKLLVSSEVELTKQELSFISENISFFTDLGFELKVQPKDISISAVPTEIVGADYSKVFKALFELEQSSLDLKNNFDKAKQDMIATIACHSSVRKGQKLNPVEMKAIVEGLLKCENPYSCPHGRPAIWKQRIEEIDKHFLRTY